MDSDDKAEVLLSTLDSITEHHYGLLEQGQDDEFNKKLLYNTLTNKIQVLEYIDYDEHWGSAYSWVKKPKPHLTGK